nr:cell death-inducing p53-target protein 1-like [Leptinotarsa decemlineata]
MSYPPPNHQAHPQGGMYPTPYNSNYPPAPAPGYVTPNAPGYGAPGQGYQPVPTQYPPGPGPYGPGQYGGPITNQPMVPGGGPPGKLFSILKPYNNDNFFITTTPSVLQLR